MFTRRHFIKASAATGAAVYFNVLGALDPVGAVPAAAGLADPALQRAQHRVAELFGVAALKLLEQRHRHQRRRPFEHRHHFRLPDLGQRVGAGSPVAWRPLRWQRGRRLDPARAGHADAHLRRRCFLAVRASECLVLVHL